MFWTRALPSAQMNPDQLKRNFNVVELSDAAILLASAMEILSSALGFKISAERGASTLGDGRPIPLMSYSLIEYLLGLDLSGFELLELGGGESTAFWAGCAKSVLSLETDAAWVETLRGHHIPNVVATLSTNATLAGDMLKMGRNFDAIVIDSSANRLHLAQSAIKMLKPAGFIILDNSDWYPNAAQVLREADLIQVDFHDFRPLHHYRCTTSLFMHPAFRPKLKSTRLPLAPIGGKDVAATNAWDIEGHV